MEPTTLYSTLVLSGFVLIGIEIFLPGGLLGIIGALIWLIAAAVGYFQFNAPWNTLSAIGLLFLLILTFILWMRFFPKSRMGRGLTLSDKLNHSRYRRCYVEFEVAFFRRFSFAFDNGGSV